MKSSDQIAQEFYSSGHQNLMQSSAGVKQYSTKQQGELFLAGQLSDNSLPLETPNNLDAKSAQDVTLINQEGSIYQTTATSFLQAVRKVKTDTDKETQEQINQLAIKHAFDTTASVKRTSDGLQAALNCANNIDGFADKYIEEALKPKNANKAAINFKALVTTPKESAFRTSLNTLIDEKATPEQLVGIFNADLGDKIDTKVIKKLAEKAPETFKDMLLNKESGLFEAIERNNLKNLTVAGESLLKASMQQPELAAQMMGAGFTLSSEEIKAKGYTPPNGKEFTANDHLRMAIAETMPKQTENIDLSKKLSPLALARATGQTKLAAALKAQGYGRSMKEVLLGRGAGDNSSASKGIISKIKEKVMGQRGK